MKYATVFGRRSGESESRHLRTLRGLSVASLTLAVFIALLGTTTHAQLALEGNMVGGVAGLGATADVIEVATADAAFAIRYADGSLAVGGLSGASPPSGAYQYTDIDGGSQILALRSNGQVIRVWGGSAVPLDLPPAIQVSAGFNGFNAVVLADGTVRCWNAGGYAETPPDLANVVKVAAGGGHAIALHDDGSVRCWGVNSDGQCDVPMDLGPVIDVAAGRAHTCVIEADGRVRCWGDNDWLSFWGIQIRTGQCDVPADLGPAVMLDAGSYHTIALLQDGSVRSWGDGYACLARDQTLNVLSGSIHVAAGAYTSTSAGEHGRIIASGMGAGLEEVCYGFPCTWCTSPWARWFIPSNAKPLVSGRITRELNAAPASGSIILGLTADGTPLCWQRIVRTAQYWDLYDGDGVCAIPEAALPAQLLHPSQTHALSIRTDGHVVQWPTVGEIALPGSAIDVAAITDHSFAVLDDGSIHYWSDNWYQGIFDNQWHHPDGGEETIDADLTPPSVMEPAIAIDAGWRHAVAVLSDGSVVAWGENEFGQTEVPDALDAVVDVATGVHHTVALRADGTVVSWGRNNHGQSTTPPDLADVVAIAADGDASAAMKADGTVVRWGAVAIDPSLPASGARLLSTELVLSGCGVRSIEVPTLALDQAGAQFFVAVNASSDACGWAARSWADWLQIDGKGYGSGSGTFEVSADANPLTRIRIGALDVGGVRRVVVQDAGLDCNDNGLGDGYEIATGAAVDLNHNGIPDDCECIADIDGNGFVDGGDIAMLLTAWGSSGTGLPADIDANGLVNGGDMGVLLSSWGSCP